MSTLLEIEKAIGTLPPAQVEELAGRLRPYRAAPVAPDAAEREALAAQALLAQQRLTALESGASSEIPGAAAHATVLASLKRRP